VGSEWEFETTITGNYEPTIAWFRTKARWEPYSPYLHWSQEKRLWIFRINNTRDNCCANTEVEQIRVYGFHNKLF
jgi:hypothetical protein